ncbi:lipase family protein [Actinomadura bangladeshensis]|uniref:Triacylglycerol lipase n=1 Tax=Actinomadura bangladeshensis TaxID=453573 RepID=A0A6L9QCN5_9ACTN|nr:lipase family protein [Actinomadura bangladeshensis]NEA22818.1 triacylglycerol lipase [Actinomadura bangladeshensis]
MSITVRRVLRTLAASCIGVAMAAATLQGTAAAAPQDPVPPGQDPFYTPPSPLPAGAPGDVIRSRPAVFSMDPLGHSPYEGVKSWQVLYRSETAQGAPTAVSGMVLVPTKAWTGQGKRPLVSYAVGTRGLGDSCAPSYTLTQGMDYEMFFVADALSRGWAVAVTDMEGLGTPGQHTYEVGRSQGKAVLNMARAAQRLPDAGLGGAPVGLWGYSQGGTSSGWAAELAKSYAPDLDLKGAFAGGVPADLLAVAKGLDGSPFVGLMFMAAVGYDTAYPELDLEKYLNDNGRDLLAKAENLCLVSVDGIGTLAGTLFKKISDYTTSDPLATPEWQQRLNANKLGSTAPSVPVLQTQAVYDEIIPFAQADTLHKAWCAKGANVTWKTYTFAEHATGMLWSEPDAMAFLTDRFAGKPATGNCAA